MKKIIFSFLILITLSIFRESSSNTLSDAEFCDNILKAIDICALHRGISCQQASVIYYKSIIDILNKTQYRSTAGSIASAFAQFCYLACIDSNGYFMYRNTFLESCMREIRKYKKW